MTMIKESAPITLDQAWEAFFTVPKSDFSERTQALLDQADNYTVDFKGTPLAVSAWGSGPAILLVHGWGGNRGQLGAFVEPLIGSGYRVVSFDGPAHGNSPGMQTNLFEYRDGLLTIAKHLGPIHAILAHSLGSLVTMMAIDEELEPKKVVQFGSLQSGEAAVMRFHFMVKSPGEVRQGFKLRMEETFGENLWTSVAGDVISTDFDIPALLIHDEKDEITPISDSQAIAAAWPGAKLVTTQGLSHRGILRDATVIEKVVEFLSD